MPSSSSQRSRILYFTVKKPYGELKSGNIMSGNVRDLALDGNLLLVSAEGGGILAYDASDAPNINTAQPFAWAEAFPVGSVWCAKVEPV